MNDQILFDRLAYIDRLRRGGIADDQARTHAEAMDSALRESVATKADLAAIGATSRVDFESLKHQVELGVVATRADIDAVKAALAGVESRLTVRFGSIVAVGVAVLAAMKFFEH